MTFSMVLDNLKQERSISEKIAAKLEIVFGGIKESGLKMFSAT